ncbi:hypothetical protein [Paenibacillus pini]|uniref:Uncharacterized protein n=1 Tax=Paenibacillus pini JCM 16418 TaxID=1236976 RepID=W7Z156_9BACL|nr:hypothetical protein [Paenibacillus pini]GAF10726.1 hypothetical protein JCM16418_4945 [Paenibacillus pini JCM 16418]
MIKNDKGKYFHIDKCYEKHLEYRKFLDEENKKWDELYKYVKSLHGIPEGIDIPSMPVARLQALRSGYDIVRGKREKKYKQGASYELMYSAYKLKEDDIKWFIHNVLLGQCDAASISKCITIMQKSLSEAWRLEQLNKKREDEKSQALTATIKDLSHLTDSSKSNYYRKKDGLDISDLL